MNGFQEKSITDGRKRQWIRGFRGSSCKPVVQKTNSNVYPIKYLTARNRDTGTIKADQSVKQISENKVPQQP